MLHNLRYFHNLVNEDQVAYADKDDTYQNGDMK